MKKIVRLTSLLAAVIVSLLKAPFAFAAAGDQFDKLNPFLIDGSPRAKELGTQFKTPGGIISQAFLYIFPAAGLILFVMILWGGFEMLMSASGGKKDAGRQRVTAAIVGFILLFSIFWIAQIIEVVFGVTIVGTNIMTF